MGYSEHQYAEFTTITIKPHKETTAIDSRCNIIANEYE